MKRGEEKGNARFVDAVNRTTRSCHGNRPILNYDDLNDLLIAAEAREAFGDVKIQQRPFLIARVTEGKAMHPSRGSPPPISEVFITILLLS